MHNADTKPKIACDKRFGGPDTRDLNLQSGRNVHTDAKTLTVKQVTEFGIQTLSVYGFLLG